MEEIANGNSNSPKEVYFQFINIFVIHFSECNLFYLQIITSHDLWQIKDIGELTRICNNVIKNNPNIVNQYKNGKTKVFKALLGIVAKETNKKAKMDSVDKLLKEMLKD